MQDDNESLSNQIVNDSSTTKKVKDVAGQMLESGLTGDALQQSLIYSGIVIGVEQCQQFFHGASVEAVMLLRNALGSLDEATLISTESDTIAALAALRKTFSNALVHRSQALQEVFLLRVEATVGIPRKYLLESAKTKIVSKTELQVLGLDIFVRMPLYFQAWSHFETIDKLQALDCRCVGCLVNGLLVAQPKGANDMSKAIKRLGSLDALMEDFAEFAITQVRENLADFVETGGEGVHSNTLLPDEALPDLLSRLMPRRKNDNDRNEDTAS